MKNLFISLIIISSNWLIAQKESSNWIVGYGKNNDSTTRFGKSILNFRKDTVNLSSSSLYQYPQMGFVNASISNKDGELILMTDGFSIYGSNQLVIEGGFELNSGKVREVYYQSGTYPVSYNHVFLPNPKNADEYSLLHIPYVYRDSTRRNLYCPYFYESNIYYDKISNKYIAKYLNRIIYEGEILKAHMAYTRHANGRDWWIIIEDNNTNTHRIFLFDPSGIRLYHTQSIGETGSLYPWSGNSIFTPDGTKFIKFTQDNQIQIFDFDRCDGILSNWRQVINEHSKQNDIEGSIAVSPNSRFLYLNGLTYIWQYDLFSPDILASLDTIGTWDNYLFNDILTTAFFQLALADDGRIYLSCHSSNVFLHRINNPNESGLDCHFKLREVKLDHYMFGCLPIMPNYSLGPILGSHCDSLNLNNTVDFDQNNFRVTQYRNEIIIESDMNYQGLSYRLVDLNGNIILNRLFDPLRIQNIALENIPNGIYFLSIQKNSNVIKIEKIVVVRN